MNTVVYHDIEGGYEFTRGIQLRVGVENLTDEDPPFVARNTQANTDSATYRPLSRTYFAQVRFSLQ